MSIHPEVTIGHVHLTVSDLDRALLFYRDILGFEITARYGDSAVFLSAGGYHHHIALNTWADKGATPAPHGEWKVSNDGEVEMVTEALDLEGLLSEIK